MNNDKVILRGTPVKTELGIRIYAGWCGQHLIYDWTNIKLPVEKVETFTEKEINEYFD